MIRLLEPLRILAAIGCVLSLIVHITALLGMNLISDRNFIFLLAGSALTYVPAFSTAQWTTRDFKQREMWKAALRGCPRCMRVMVNVLGFYAVASFFLFAALSSRRSQPGGAIGPQMWWMSTYGMAFYWTSFALLHSALSSKETDLRRRCTNGHSVSPLAKYCDECGAPVEESGVAR